MPKELCSDDCHDCVATSWYVPKVGFSDSTVTEHCLAPYILRLADRIVHWKKDRLSGHGILGCIPADGEAKRVSHLSGVPT